MDALSNNFFYRVDRNGLLDIHNPDQTQVGFITVDEPAYGQDPSIGHAVQSEFKQIDKDMFAVGTRNMVFNGVRQRTPDIIFRDTKTGEFPALTLEYATNSALAGMDRVNTDGTLFTANGQSPVEVMKQEQMRSNMFNDRLKALFGWRDVSEIPNRVRRERTTSDLLLFLKTGTYPKYLQTGDLNDLDQEEQQGPPEEVQQEMEPQEVPMEDEEKDMVDEQPESFPNLFGIPTAPPAPPLPGSAFPFIPEAPAAPPLPLPSHDPTNPAIAHGNQPNLIPEPIEDEKDEVLQLDRDIRRYMKTLLNYSRLVNKEAPDRYPDEMMKRNVSSKEWLGEFKDAVNRNDNTMMDFFMSPTDALDQLLGKLGMQNITQPKMDQIRAFLLPLIPESTRSDIVALPETYMMLRARFTAMEERFERLAS